MRRSKVFLAALSLALLPVTSHAAEYFVSLSGDDANPGTLSAPFRTITHAGWSVKPGDTVTVRAGEYRDKVYIEAKGTASDRIVFRAYPGERVIIDGSDLAAGRDLVALVETEYLDFTGFEVRNAKHIAITAWRARETRILDNHVYNATRNGIYAGAETPGVSSDITISGNTVHNTVQENQYHDMGTEGWAGALVAHHSDRSTITNNKVYNNDGEGIIALRGDHFLIQGNEIYDNFSVELYIDNAQYVTADRNLIYSTGNSRWFREGLPAAGIAVANETNTHMNASSDNVFTNNIVVGSRWGFYYGNFESGGGFRNSKVINNTFYGTVQEIIRIENDDNVNSVVENNIFYQVGSVAPKYAGGTGVTFSNNLWYGGSAGVADGDRDVYGDPLFTNPGGFKAADYKLRMLSPAIHIAAAVTGLDRDYFGQARTPAFDIGAHEHSLALGSSAPVTPLPVAPTAVTARLFGEAVRLSWTAAEGSIFGYNVYRNGKFFDTVQTTMFVDSNLKPGKTYSYEISTQDNRGNESPRTAPVSLTTAPAADTTAPSAPERLRGRAASKSTIELSWSAATDSVGVTHYVVYRDGVRIANPASGTSHTDSGLKSGTSYTYRVTAVDAAGNESKSSETITAATKKAGRSRAVR